MFVPQARWLEGTSMENLPWNELPFQPKDEPPPQVLVWWIMITTKTRNGLLHNRHCFFSGLLLFDILKDGGFPSTIPSPPPRRKRWPHRVKKTQVKRWWLPSRRGARLGIKKEKELAFSISKNAIMNEEIFKRNYARLGWPTTLLKAPRKPFTVLIINEACSLKTCKKEILRYKRKRTGNH